MTQLPESLAPDREETSLPENISWAKQTLAPITAQVREGIAKYGGAYLRDLVSYGLPTTGTGILAVEELIRQSPSGGPIGEIALGGAIGVGLQGYIRRRPHLAQSIRDQFIAGFEIQGTLGVITAEMLNWLRTGHFSPESLLVLGVFVDEFIADAVHAKNGWLGEIPIDTKHIARVSTAFLQSAASLYGALRLSDAGRPEIAWALGLVGLLNFGEAALTSADRETMLVRALVKRTKTMARDAFDDFQSHNVGYVRAVDHNLQFGHGQYYSLERKIPAHRQRAAIWQDAAQYMSALVKKNPEISAIDTDQALTDFLTGALRIPYRLVGEVDKLFASPRVAHDAMSAEAHAQIKILNEDLPNLRQLAFRQARFWTFPREVDDRVKEFYKRLFAGRADEAADVISEQADSTAISGSGPNGHDRRAIAELFNKQNETPISSDPLSDDEQAWANYLSNALLDERVNRDDLDGFLDAIDKGVPAVIRLWMYQLQDDYPFLFSDEESSG